MVSTERPRVRAPQWNVLPRFMAGLACLAGLWVGEAAAQSQAAPLRAMVGTPGLPPAAVARLKTPVAIRARSNAAAAGACPDQGGLLDSVTVPVGQPLALSVYIGVPAPSGGVAFEVSSSDPSVVAAGDPRQAFRPRVFVPEGEVSSNTFLVYGVRVGRTALNIVDLTTGSGASQFPLGAWDVNGGGASKFLDANHPAGNCRASDSSNSLSTDPTRLAQCGIAVRGVAADGLSQLLMRTVSGLPGTMCYQITSSSGYDQGQISNAVVGSQQVGSLQYGFGFLKSPDSFMDTADYREVEVEFTFTPSIGNGNTTSFRSKTKIVRPPVVLLHGLASNSKTWSDDFIFHTGYRTTHVADYSATNTARFSANASLVRGFVSTALEATRSKNFAVTQADVIGHSMGGILTRMYIGGATYKRPDNFGMGDVRRLVSLDTPHSGSTFANLIAALHRVNPVDTAAAYEGFANTGPAGGAVCDLAENSPGLKTLNTATSVKARVLTGTGGPAGTQQAPADFLRGARVYKNIEYELTRTYCKTFTLQGVCLEFEHVFPQDIVDAFRFRQANDAIVSLVSQQGGHCSSPGIAGVNFPELLHSGPTVTLFGYGFHGATTDPEPAKTAYALLDGPASAFSDAFPGVGSDGLGHACTVPGRGAVLDAQDYADQCASGGALTENPRSTLATPTARRAASAPSSVKGASASPGAGLAADGGDNRAQITAPLAGQVFVPGATMSIVVVTAPSLQATDVAVAMPGFGTLGTTTIDGATFQASFTIPDFHTGPITLTPIARSASGQPIVGLSSTIAVRSAAAPVAIRFQQKDYRLTPLSVGTIEALAVVGTYADGAKRDVSSAAAGTTYSSSDSAVVSVDADGMRRVVGYGMAIVTATNGGQKDFATFLVQDPAQPPQPTNVSVQVTVQQGGVRLDRNSGFFVQTLTLTNSGSVPIPGPLYLVLSGLPNGVNLVNQSGLTQAIYGGTPYLIVPLGTDGLNLRPGERVSFTAQYLNPDRVNFGVVPTVWRSSTGP